VSVSINTFLLIVLSLWVLIQHLQLGKLANEAYQMRLVRHKEMDKVRALEIKVSMASDQAYAALSKANAVGERQGRLRTKVAGLHRDLALSGVFVTKGDDT
jgi:hypothetical protein